MSRASIWSQRMLQSCISLQWLFRYLCFSSTLHWVHFCVGCGICYHVKLLFHLCCLLKVAFRFWFYGHLKVISSTAFWECNCLIWPVNCWLLPSFKMPSSLLFYQYSNCSSIFIEQIWSIHNKSVVLTLPFHFMYVDESDGLILIDLCFQLLNVVIKLDYLLLL